MQKSIWREASQKAATSVVLYSEMEPHISEQREDMLVTSLRMDE